MVIWRPLIFYTISCLFLLFVSFFFLMIRRPPRSTLFPYTDALPIWRPAPAALLRAGGRWRSRGDLLRRADRRHGRRVARSEEHTSELQSLAYLVCRLLLEKKKKPSIRVIHICTLYYYT